MFPGCAIVVCLLARTKPNGCYARVVFGNFWNRPAASGTVLAISGQHRDAEGDIWLMELESGSDEESSALAVYKEQRFGAALADRLLELRDVANGLMVDLLDDVAFL